MPLKLQMQNVGAEVTRAIRFKKANKHDRVESRIQTAIGMLSKMCSDPKNKNRINEFKFMQKELEDYFLYDGKLYDADEQGLIRQYDIFNDY